MNTEEKTYISFVSPSIVLLALLTIGPLILLVSFSLTRFSLIRPGSFQFYGVGNFIRMVQSGRFINAVKVSLFYIFFNTIIQLLLGFIIGLLLYRKRKRGTKFLRSVFLLPMLVPPVVVGLTWRVLLTPDLGGLNYFLGLLGIQGPTWLGASLPALFAVTIAAIWEWTPFVILILLAALETVPENFLEAAVIDGASWPQQIRHIIIPYIRPTILVVVILRIIESLGILPVIFVLTGGGPSRATETINLYAFEVGINYLDIGYASSLVIVFIFIILIFSSIFMKLSLGRGRNVKE